MIKTEQSLKESDTINSDALTLPTEEEKIVLHPGLAKILLDHSLQLKKSSILITAGPTNESIDEVMKITNMSTGRLGVSLAHEFLQSGSKVTLIATRSVVRSSLFEKCKLDSFKGFTCIPIETTQDMFTSLKQESKHSHDMVIHTSAVADYKPQFTFKMEDMADLLVKAIIEGKTSYEEILKILVDPDCKVNDDTKISSYEPNLTVKLGLTEKLISHLREWYPDSVLIGFKLLDKVSKDTLINVAQKLCVKNNMDYIIANDLGDLRNGIHVSYLVNEQGYLGTEFHSPQDIATKAKQLLFTRK